MDAPRHCSACGQGVLVVRGGGRRKLVRVAGLIVLVVSVLGTIMSVVMALAAGPMGAALVEKAIAMEAQRLRSNGLPADLIETVAASEVITETQRAALSEEQRRSLDDFEIWVASTSAAGAAAARLSRRNSIFTGALCLGAGAASLLLVRRRKVLRCNHCGAVVPANSQ